MKDIQERQRAFISSSTSLKTEQHLILTSLSFDTKSFL